MVNSNHGHISDTACKIFSHMKVENHKFRSHTVWLQTHSRGKCSHISVTYRSLKIHLIHLAGYNFVKKAQIIPPGGVTTLPTLWQPHMNLDLLSRKHMSIKHTQWTAPVIWHQDLQWCAADELHGNTYQITLYRVHDRGTEIGQQDMYPWPLVSLAGTKSVKINVISETRACCSAWLATTVIDWWHIIHIKSLIILHEQYENYCRFMVQYQ